MNQTNRPSTPLRKIVFLVGASGVGKTTTAGLLQRRSPWVGRTHFFDSIGVPSPEEMEEEFGGGEAWQEWATGQWVSRLVEEGPNLQLLEGQTRPHYILKALRHHPDVYPAIVLLDCDSETRRRRLSAGRNQPELANTRMEHWAAYLRGQADALGLDVIDTSHITPEAAANRVEILVFGANSPTTDRAIAGDQG